MFQSLLLSAKAQPVQRSLTSSSRPIRESVTIISPPSPEPEPESQPLVPVVQSFPELKPVGNWTTFQGPLLGANASPPLAESDVTKSQPPVTLSLSEPKSLGQWTINQGAVNVGDVNILPPPPEPWESPVQQLQQQVQRVEARLEALDQSDARTKASVAQLMSKLDDKIQVLKVELEKIEGLHQTNLTHLAEGEVWTDRIRAELDELKARLDQTITLSQFTTLKTEGEASEARIRAGLSGHQVVWQDRVEEGLTNLRKELSERIDRLDCIANTLYSVENLTGPAAVPTPEGKEAVTTNEDDPDEPEEFSLCSHRTAFYGGVLMGLFGTLAASPLVWSLVQYGYRQFYPLSDSNGLLDSYQYDAFYPTFGATQTFR